MRISKNKKYQFFFLFIISIYAIFNGGNSNILIQINFILISIFFIFSIRDKNYYLHLKNFYSNNKIFIIFYFVFLLYLLFQILPLPHEILKFFSIEKYNYIKKLDTHFAYLAISLSPTESFFQILNYTSIILLLFITKMIFYTDRHKYRFYFFLSLIGFISSVIAISFYLNGNPDFYFISNSSYKEASTGFFINRVAYAIFLLFCFIACLKFIKNLDQSKFYNSKDKFFLKIYVRLFVLFITIGIITTFSRIGNFLLLITLLYYLINEFFFELKKNKYFAVTILLIIAVDVIILGIFFGNSQIVDRFSFLSDEFAQINSPIFNLSRAQIAKFALNQFLNFSIFGYGSGNFETIFQLNFLNSSSSFANHAHSDILEFLGEFGILGSGLIILSLSKFFFSKNILKNMNLLLIIFLIIILFFDFSLHIPIIQIFFVIFFSFESKNF
tara:strand:- start:15015 stop:16343 length:1329 start_codon:yes stop_codon:yes gene_type:complete